MSEDNDLTDRYNSIVGNTLEDDWDDNPDPPPGYGQPDPRVIIEEVGDKVWAWDTMNWRANIKFSGNPVDITQ